MVDTIVREFSRAGPCITLGKLTKETPRFWIYATWKGGTNYGPDEHRVSKQVPGRYCPAHVTPCPSCTDHPKTQYPNGYMD